MEEELNQALITAIKARLLNDTNLVNFVTRTLSIGKEAAYRRLRGDVSFTFYEVVQMAKSMGISLDEIVGRSRSNEALFALNIQKSGDPFDYLFSVCKNYRDLYIYIKDDPQTVMNSALNNLPVVSHAHYKTLTKFRLYRWLHAISGKGIKCFDDFQVSPRLLDILSDIYDLQLEIPLSIVIWDQNIIKNLLQDIRYYMNLSVLSKENVEQMKEDLLEILDNVEDLAFTGKHPGGNNVHLYISSINIESSYIHIQKEDFRLSVFNMYAIDYIHSQHPDMCDEQKKWIDSLKKYSILITQCGERQRLAFFREQKECIKSLTF